MRALIAHGNVYLKVQMTPLWTIEASLNQFQILGYLLLSHKTTDFRYILPKNWLCATSIRFNWSFTRFELRHLWFPVRTQSSLSEWRSCYRSICWVLHLIYIWDHYLDAFCSSVGTRDTEGFLKSILIPSLSVCATYAELDMQETIPFRWLFNSVSFSSW